MRRLTLFFLAFLFAQPAAAQGIRFGGSHPPDSAAIATAIAYGQASAFDSVDERAARLAPLQAEG